MNFINKLSIILNNSIKRYFFILLILIIFSAFLEIIGLALIIPLIYMVINNPIDGVINLLSMLNFKNYFDYDLSNVEKIDEKLLSNIIVLSFIIIYLFKNSFLLFLNFLIATFVANTNVFLSNQAVNFFIKSKYESIIKFRFSNFFSAILNEINIFTYGVVLSIINIISELIVLFSIIFLLILIEGIESIIVFGFLFLSSLIFIFFIKNKIKNWGKKRQKFDQEKIDILNKSTRLIRDIKFYNLEKLFLKIFTTKDRNLANYQKNNAVAQSIPKLLLEIVIVITISIYIIFSKNFDKNNVEPLVKIALYAAFAIRLLPSFNKIMFNFQQFIYAKPSVNRLLKYKKNFNHYSKNSSNSPVKFKELTKFKKKIYLKNISFKFKNKLILKNLNLIIKKKNIIGIFGESGSGKTTLADILSGLIRNFNGKIIIDNEEVGPSDNLNKIIGYSQQNPVILQESLFSNIAFGETKKKIDVKKLNKIIKICHLSELKNKKFSSIGSNISGGQKQRISIARALYFDPKLLILDESTSGLDKNLETKIIDNIKKNFKDITLIIISHNTKTLSKCNLVYELKNKQLMVK